MYINTPLVLTVAVKPHTLPLQLAVLGFEPPCDGVPRMSGQRLEVQSIQVEGDAVVPSPLLPSSRVVGGHGDIHHTRSLIYHFPLSQPLPRPPALSHE